MLSHLVTSRCNACCPTCLWRDPDGRELAADDIRWLYHQAGAAGIVHLVMWGGEPLLRTDLPELLEAAQQAGLVVTLISNGHLLRQRWPEIRGRVDALIVSLDDAGTAHDRQRGLPGLFADLDDFVPGLRSDPLRPKLLVNTVLSRLNRGALRRVAEVARAWRVGLYFCPMETGRMETGGFAESLGHLSLPLSELREAARLARLLKRSGYPIMATDAYLELLAADPDLTAYTCRAPRAILTTEADGSFRDCLRRDRSLATVPQMRAAGQTLDTLFARPRYRAMLAEAEHCTACNNPDVIEISWLWDLELQMLERAVGLVVS